jgi:hypothetical protein
MSATVDRRVLPPFPLATGTVARLIRTTEPRLSETVRRDRVHPEPVIVAGRRLWTYEQVLQAAEVLGVLNSECRVRIEQAFGISPTQSVASQGRDL